MPIYVYNCPNGHEIEVLRSIKERHDPCSCPRCEKGLTLGVSTPGLTRLEPIPMDRTGHTRRAARRRERITGQTASIDYNSPTYNDKRGQG